MTRAIETVTDEKARRIIAKALQLDSQGLTTMEELNAIADEVGISPAAFEAAMALVGRVARRSAR